MYSKTTIVGALGKDPEMRYTPGGKAVTSFNVATNHQYTGANGERVKETLWFRVSAWGRQAETCQQYLRKGSKVLVEGRLTGDPTTGGPRVWTRQDGTAGASFEINASQVTFLSSHSEGHSEGQHFPAGADGDDDIPF